MRRLLTFLVLLVAVPAFANVPQSAFSISNHIWAGLLQTLWVTNSAANETVSDTFDLAGHITFRTWKSASRATNRTHALFWDGRGRLFKVSERDSADSGFDWS